jgi:hypothetical protein
MKPISTALAAAALIAALAGCSDDSGTLGPASTAATTAPATPAIDTTPGRRPAVAYEAWLVRDGLLYSTRREGRAGVVGVATRALGAVAAGPTRRERGAGVFTMLSAGDGLVVTDIARSVATVVFEPAFRRGDRRARRLREAQVVFTATQFPTIKRVRFVPSTGSSPASVRTRRDFDELLPAILVDAPAIGETTHSPLPISGSANVFEATVSIRVLDASGRAIARTFTTATCGTGCRGDYTASLPYTVDTAQDGTLEVFDVSAEDASRQDVVSVPIRLSPPSRAPAG